MQSLSSIKFSLRASMLDSYLGCGLRTAVAVTPHLFRAAGHEVKPRGTTIGAAVGQGLHSGIAYAFREKQQTGYTPNRSDYIEAGIESFREQTAKGVLVDAITKNSNQGEKAVRKLLIEYTSSYGYRVDPIAVEQRYSMTISGVVVSGSTDNEFAHSFDDVKSGKTLGAYLLQIGTYRLLQIANKVDKKFGNIVYLQRVKDDANSKPPVIIPYDLLYAERAAYIQLQRVIVDYKRFIKTEDPLSFPINPASWLCSEHYCPLFGGNVCLAWKTKR